MTLQRLHDSKISTPKMSSPVTSGILIQALKSSEGARPKLSFLLRLRNKSNRLLLYNLGEAKSFAASFRLRPTDTGILTPGDVQPIAFLMREDFNHESEIALMIKTAFIEKTDTGGQNMVDASQVWQGIDARKISSLTIPVRFEVVTKTDAPSPKPTVIVVDLEENFGINWLSPNDLIEKLAYVRRHYAEEFWAVEMLALIVVVVAFSVGFLVGSLFVKPR